MKLLIRDHDNLFVLSELAHFSGIGFLVYKLLRVESCEGAGRAGLGLLHSALLPQCWPSPRATHLSRLREPLRLPAGVAHPLTRCPVFAPVDAQVSR